MFDWLGFRKGLPLWWSYRLNRHLKEDVEHIFEGIAHTRTEILRSWVESYWSHLDRLHATLSESGSAISQLSQDSAVIQKMLAAALKSGADFSEIFILNERAGVTYSTYPDHVGKTYVSGSGLMKGLEETRRGEKCLFGPFLTR